MKLLVHSCCAPCSISCVADIRLQNIEPHLFWYNPNIHPGTEYTARRDSLSEFAKSDNLELIIDNETLDFFLSKSAENTILGESRKFCEKCYSIRLEKTASFAAKKAYNAFTTTLLISPYQNHEMIKSIGEQMAAKYNVDFYYRDFRPLFRESQSTARARKMYMQKYCGCMK